MEFKKVRITSDTIANGKIVQAGEVLGVNEKEYKQLKRADKIEDFNEDITQLVTQESKGFTVEETVSKKLVKRGK